MIDSLPRSYRDYLKLVGMALQAAFLGLIIGTVFFQLDETLADVQSLKNLAYQMGPTYF